MNNTFDEDELTGKAYDARIFRRIMTYILPFKFTFISAILLLLLSSGLQVVQPYLTKIAVDKYIIKGDFHGLIRFGWLFFGVIFSMGITIFFQRYISNMLGQKFMKSLRMAIFTHLQELSLSFFNKNPIGRLVTRATNDVQAINEMITSGVIALVGDVFRLSGITVVLYLLNRELALLTYIFIPLLIIASFIFRKYARVTYRESRRRLAKLNAFLQESISGMSIIQVFNREARMKARFVRLNNDYLKINMKSILIYSLFYPSVDFILNITLALILYFSASMILKATLTIGVLVAYIQYIDQFFEPIRDLSNKYNIMQQAMASSERIFKLLDTKEIIPDSKYPVKSEQTKGNVKFEHVWFAYNDDDYVLKDVSFEVKAGQTFAIVGATGAGKTSLMNLLFRFYDANKGRILIDDIDIRNYAKRDIRKRMAIVLQDVFLFMGDIKYNIRLGNSEISDEKIQECARDIGADEFIKRLTNEYDEPIKERGATLSVGQRQLISFARALAFNPQILVLDEATASIDPETESLIQRAMKRLMKGRTSIIIAHRLSTIRDADNIIVIDRGKVVENGTHEELMKLKGVYYKLYMLQALELKRKEA
ncbi:MAG: ABC transporter ATP-binding protein [Thermotogae bacterium]|nr:ABC transporter ATP-binding protein [Thermotogota bacterium]